VWCQPMQRLATVKALFHPFLCLLAPCIICYCTLQSSILGKNSHQGLATLIMFAYFLSITFDLQNHLLVSNRISEYRRSWQSDISDVSH
jgi:hypothetical protein